MKGMILAAGLGTRLRPLTWTTPKPMVPLCNRPLVAWAVESYLAAGVEDLVVNLHYLPEPIERFLSETYHSRARLHFSFEEEILGTGGAIRRVRDQLSDGDFFLVNGDTVQFPPFHRLRAHREHLGSIAALTLRHPPEHDRFTPVWFDDERVTGFGEGIGEALMFAGSHAISSRIFDHFPDEEVFGIVDRVYQPLLAAQAPIGAVVEDGLWFDIGKASRYLEASSSLLDAMAEGKINAPAGSQLRDGSLVAASAHVTGPIEKSTVAERSRIEGSLASSIIWSGCRIGPRVRLERCIVGDGVELAGDLLLRDAVICADDRSIPTDVVRHDGLIIAAV